MPSKPPRPCPTPGCANLIEGPQRRCPPCTKRHHRAVDAARPTVAQRGYGGTWRKLRTLKLNRTPGCETPGCTEVATDVDHIKPLREGGSNSLDNLRSLCHPHHSQVTRRWQNSRSAGRGPRP